ncbi:MAG: hypothetical protein R2883_02625 [Caldisericia bacterium]
MEYLKDVELSAAELKSLSGSELYTRFPMFVVSNISEDEIGDKDLRFYKRSHQVA